MAYNDQLPLSDVTVNVFNPAGGTPAGSKSYILSPVRGRLMSVGFSANSLVTSAMTLAVAIGSQASATASSYAQVVTSTLGTFAAANLYEGAPAVVIPASPVYVSQYDPIQFTTSGGQSSTVGLTCFATFRRA